MHQPKKHDVELDHQIGSICLMNSSKLKKEIERNPMFKFTLFVLKIGSVNMSKVKGTCIEMLMG